MTTKTTKKNSARKIPKIKAKEASKTRAGKALPVSEEVDIDLGEFDLKKIKAKTTIYLDGEVWDKLHENAEKANMKYQPYLNQLLRRVLLDEKTDFEKRLERLESLVLKNKAV